MRPMPTRVHCSPHVRPERKQHQNQQGAVHVRAYDHAPYRPSNLAMHSKLSKYYRRSPALGGGNAIITELVSEKQSEA